MRDIDYIRPCLKTVQEFPDEVRAIVAHALMLAANGSKHQDAKPMVGFPGSSVMEIAVRHDGNAYRVVYALGFSDAIYVIHAFQKKSHTGIRTPKPETNLITARIKALRALHKKRVNNDECCENRQGCAQGQGRT